jgi:hypothetical protein
VRCDERESASGGRAVVVGDPEPERDEWSRNAVDDWADVGQLDADGRIHPARDDHAADPSRAELDVDDIPLRDGLDRAVRKRARERARRHEWIDLDEWHRGRA